MISALALVASAGVIVSYFYTTKTGKVRPLHWANALGATPIALAAALAGAWASVPLTVLFGAAGAWGLVRTRRNG